MRFLERCAAQQLAGEGTGEGVACTNGIGNLDVGVSSVETSPFLAVMVLNVAPPVRMMYSRSKRSMNHLHASSSLHSGMENMSRIMISSSSLILKMFA